MPTSAGSLPACDWPDKERALRPEEKQSDLQTPPAPAVDESIASGGDRLPEHERREFEKAVLEGLRARPRRLPCKYFYDVRGSQLFDRICETEEYYVTRAELSILEENAAEMARQIGPRAAILEPGAGSLHKIRLLLPEMPDLAAYLPTDISGRHLHNAARQLSREFPRISIHPEVLDFHDVEGWGRLFESHAAARRVVFFPGSTIGNYQPQEAQRFLNQIASRLHAKDGILIGVDLVKDRATLEAAYNDHAGYTAAFNKNLLTRINRELQGDLRLNHFEHHARFHAEQSRVEMHLVSKVDQIFHVAGHRFAMKKGDSIHTENSCKYTIEAFTKLAVAAGLRRACTWTDADELFSVHYLQVV
ncbi:MAG: L-histidine N(alpha)-methyltransferase [Leptospiraceae bacterium]|nr:L-histidine N(alpha)-methyltransferase [Leptospiraceae bacterium]